MSLRKELLNELKKLKFLLSEQFVEDEGDPPYDFSGKSPAQVRMEKEAQLDKAQAEENKRAEQEGRTPTNLRDPRDIPTGGTGGAGDWYGSLTMAEKQLFNSLKSNPDKGAIISQISGPYDQAQLMKLSSTELAKMVIDSKRGGGKKTRRGSGMCRLPEILTIQKYYNYKYKLLSKQPASNANATNYVKTAPFPTVKVDGIYGSQTRKAIEWLMTVLGAEPKYRPTPCNKQSFQTFVKFFTPVELRTDAGIDKASAELDQGAKPTAPAGPDPAPKGPSAPGASGAGAPALEESKSWLDKTREKSSNSLFERLVKDASKKKVL